MTIKIVHYRKEIKTLDDGEYEMMLQAMVREIETMETKSLEE